LFCPLGLPFFFSAFLSSFSLALVAFLACFASFAGEVSEDDDDDDDDEDEDDELLSDSESDDAGDSVASESICTWSEV
jgi:hypothetical protein